MARNVNPSPGTQRPVQRGNFMLPAGATTQVDVAINPIDPAKAQLFVNGWYVQNGESLTANNDTALLWQIINSTTIRFSRPIAGSASPYIAGNWELKSWS